MSNLADLSLDELFAQVKKSHDGQKKQKALARQREVSAPKQAEESAAQRLYNDPDNWERVRGIALIEEGSETLLGNFSEYIHRLVPGARKLVRELVPIGVEAVEYVKGWVPGETRHEAPIAQRSFVANIFLKLTISEFVGVQAEVRAYHNCGSITRVELLNAASLCMPGEEILTLPAGTNVLEVLAVQALKILELEIDK